MPRSWFQSASLPDDRGGTVPLWQYDRTSESDDPYHRAIAARANQISQNELQLEGCLVGLLVGVAFAVGGILGLPLYMTLSLGLAGVMILNAWQRRRRARVVLPAVRATLVSDCRCASCAYDLLGIPAEPDGCTVCPECDAAWRLPAAAEEARKARERLDPSPPRREDETSADVVDRQRLRRWLVGGGRGYTAKDEAGRLVEIVSPAPFARRPPRWSTLPPEQRRALKFELWMIGWPPRLLAVLGALILMGMGLLMWPLVKPSMFMLALNGLALLLYAYAPSARHSKTIVRTMLRSNRCPSCADSLAGCEPDDLNIITCGACRSKWARPIRAVPPPRRMVRTLEDDAWFNPAPPRASRPRR